MADSAATAGAAHGIAYRPEIDGMRAIAVLAVILYHAGIGGFSGGFVGVDIFFVISGYLIGSIIIGDAARDRFSFANFYERRVRRIAPALFLVLGVTTLAAPLLQTPQQLRDYGQALMATVTFLSNIYFDMKTNYFNADTENNPLIHMWSLSVEEQFYLLFPFVIVAARRWAVLRLEWVLPLLFAISLALCLRGAAVDPAGNFFPPHVRAWELLAGAIVAVYRPHWQRVTADRHPPGELLSIAGAAAMIVPIFTYDKTTVFPGAATIPVVVGAALVILACDLRTIVGRLLAMSPMVGVGLISYSAYLWHQPLFAFVRAAAGGHLTMTANVLLIGLTLALAWASWRFVERPFRKPAQGGHWRVFAVAGAISLLFLAIGAVFHLSRGLPQRFDSATLARAATTAPSPLRIQCHTEGRAFRDPASACRYFVGPARWTVLGDSHGVEIAYALAEALRGEGAGVRHMTFSGCQPALTFESDNPGCSAWLRVAVDTIVRDPATTDVLLTFRHIAYLRGELRATYPALPDDRPAFLRESSPEAARAAYWASLRKLVMRLAAAGKRVHLLMPIPELPVPIDRYVFAAERAPPPITRALYRQRNAEVLVELATLDALPGVELVDPSGAVCGPAQCAAMINGTALYFDDNHFSLAGARRFVAQARANGQLR